MTAAELLSKLRSLDVNIWADNGQLCCNAPKGALTEDLRTAMSERKAEILAFLSDASAQVRPVDPPMRPVPRGRELPLSFAQERLWFLDQLEQGRSVYHMSSTFRLTGALNVDALERSLAEIVRRHEALRTTFTTVEDRPIQVIVPSSAAAGVDLFRLMIVDLRHLGESQRHDEALRFAGEEIRRPFNLTTDLMIRAGLCRLGAEEHILFLALHHIASDGWSMGVLYRELSALYEAFSKERSSPLPELRIQYADFAQWQRKRLEGDLLQAQVAYWKRQLRDLPILELPSDRLRPAVQTYRGARQTARLAKGPTDALKALSWSEGASLFMTLLAAFQALLYRHTGQEDIVVGTPIAGRNRVEIEELIGFFLNSLVLRTDLSGDCTFRELLRRVREVTFEAYAHQDVPFEKLLQEIRPERDLSRTPLFQVFFNMINLGGGTCLQLPGLKVQPMSVSDVESKFDLTVYVREDHQGLQFNLVYNSDLYEPGTIKRLLACYCALLEGIGENPDRCLTRYRLLIGEERRVLAGRRNRIAPENKFVEFKTGEVEQSITARFERQARLFPAKAAVKTAKHQWSYRELNDRANQIARTLLKRRGAGPERIALLFRHNANMTAAILGVLKSAKTYVPLETTYPMERLGWTLQDTESTVILCDQKTLRLARELAAGARVVIDIEMIDAAMPAEDLSLSVSPEAMAYILYTSGSTGEPKGVMQNHRNVLHHIRCYTNALHIASEDKLTLLSSYSFDAAVMDIFGALLNGATLYPLNIREQDAAALRRRMRREGITIYHSTPTVFRYICDGTSGHEDFTPIRMVVLGGEETQTADLALFRQFFPEHSLLVNGLGPTESTLALQYFMNHGGEPVGRIIPAGYPVEDTEILLLNRDGSEAEIYGEIGIRSEHVALGYWRRPELSKTAFISEPEGGKRIYRTGDIGRLMTDGSIRYLGRRDRQVKIRGYRIELGEIEAALKRHSTVREAAVVIHEDQSAGKYLLAYIVAAEERPLLPGEWRAYLKASLPDYMVPADYVYVDKVSLMPNGKLDRGALPKPDSHILQLQGVFVAPRSPKEEMLVELWREVLGGRQVGIHDNFFELGGHSLLALRIVSRLSQSLHTEISLRLLFENPTIAGLASKIEVGKYNGVAKHTMDQLLDDLESLSDEQAEELLNRSETNNKREDIL